MMDSVIQSQVCVYQILEQNNNNSLFNHVHYLQNDINEFTGIPYVQTKYI